MFPRRAVLPRPGLTGSLLAGAELSEGTPVGFSGATAMEFTDDLDRTIGHYHY